MVFLANLRKYCVAITFFAPETWELKKESESRRMKLKRQKLCAKQIHFIKTWSDQAVVMKAKKHEHFLNEENICFSSFSF